MTITLSWQEGAPDQPGHGFRIYRSVNGGSFTLYQTVPLTQTSFQDENVSWGNVYCYRICEYFQDSESSFAEACAALLGDVGQITEIRELYFALSCGDSGTAIDLFGPEILPTQTDQAWAEDRLTNVQADLQAQEQAQVEDALVFIWRAFMSYNLDDLGTGEDDLALFALTNTLEYTAGHEAFSVLNAVSSRDTLLGQEKIRMGVQAYGQPWGLARVPLEAIQS